MPFTKNDPNINRNGRPPSGESWSELIREAGEIIDLESKKQYKALVVEQLYLKAIRGDISAIKEIIDRTDGKPKMTGECKDIYNNPSNSIDFNDPKTLITLIRTAEDIVENAKNMKVESIEELEKDK